MAGDVEEKKNRGNGKRKERLLIPIMAAAWSLNGMGRMRGSFIGCRKAAGGCGGAVVEPPHGRELAMAANRRRRNKAERAALNGDKSIERVWRGTSTLGLAGIQLFCLRGIFGLVAKSNINIPHTMPMYFKQCFLYSSFVASN